VKKMMNTLGIVAIASIATISTIETYPIKKRALSEANMLGQQVIRELGESVKQANEVFKAAIGDEERQSALKNAREAAQTLINTLNDIKTFGNDVVNGYNPAQRRHAAITLAELLMRENSQKIQIESKRLEIRDMTDIGYFVDTAKSGKVEARSQAEKKQRELHAELKDIRKAMSDQEMILGQPWSNTIKLTIHNLIVGNSYGIAYGIDWYSGAPGAQLLETNGTTKKQSAARTSQHTRSAKLTKKQHAAIRSWHNLSKSELLSKEIATAYQLNQAKDLLEKMIAIKQDLKDVSEKYQHIADKVSSSIDSLERKIDRAKVSWLKVA
jgi:hypothetical protein